ncbi:TIGR03032 family protein [Sphingomonas colocasiae]|nr:TIGR03032 family protein [Sphingomonas colocasiae]
MRRETWCNGRIGGVVRELYDVAALPGIRNPAVIGFRTEEVRKVISVEE